MAQLQTVLPRVQTKNNWDKLWRALDERLALHALAYPVPEYANTIPYTLGGITLFGFIVLFATGILPKRMTAWHISSRRFLLEISSAASTFGQRISSSSPRCCI